MAQIKDIWTSPLDDRHGAILERLTSTQKIVESCHLLDKTIFRLTVCSDVFHFSINGRIFDVSFNYDDECIALQKLYTTMYGDSKIPQCHECHECNYE